MLPFLLLYINIFGFIPSLEFPSLPFHPLSSSLPSYQQSSLQYSPSLSPQDHLTSIILPPSSYLHHPSSSSFVPPLNSHLPSYLTSFFQPSSSIPSFFPLPPQLAVSSLPPSSNFHPPQHSVLFNASSPLFIILPQPDSSFLPYSFKPFPPIPPSLHLSKNCSPALIPLSLFIPFPSLILPHNFHHHPKYPPSFLLFYPLSIS
jgi:hypothetical protein